MIFIWIGIMALLIFGGVYFQHIQECKERKIADEEVKRFNFYIGDILYIKGSNRPMVFTGFNGYHEAKCAFLDGTNQWSSFNPLILTKKKSDLGGEIGL